MALPLLLVKCACGVGCVVVSFLVAAGIKKLVDWWKSQRMLLLGMSGAGKTTFCNALYAMQEKNENWKAGIYINTLEQEKHKYDNTFHFIDTAGIETYKKLWDNTIENENPNFILYFYDVSRLGETMTLNNEFKCYYYKNMAADLKLLSALCGKHKKKLLLIGTHTDANYDTHKANQYLADVFSHLGECEYCRIEGSLADYKSAVSLFKEIKEKAESMKI